MGVGTPHAIARSRGTGAPAGPWDIELAGKGRGPFRISSVGAGEAPRVTSLVCRGLAVTLRGSVAELIEMIWAVPAMNRL